MRRRNSQRSRLGKRQHHYPTIFHTECFGKCIIQRTCEMGIDKTQRRWIANGTLRAPISTKGNMRSEHQPYQISNMRWASATPNFTDEISLYLWRINLNL